MGEPAEDAGSGSGPMTLGRIDVTRVGEDDAAGAGTGVVHCRQLSTAAVRARVVPTAEAPEVSEVPRAYLAAQRARFLAEGNERDAAALGDGAIARRLADQAQWGSLRPHLNDATGARGLDVAFANVGWVSVVEPAGFDFEIRARPVEGSLVWTRPPLYEAKTEVAGVAEVDDEAAKALRMTPPSERAYDVAEVERFLAEADSRSSEAAELEEAEERGEGARAAALGELGSQRRRAQVREEAPEGIDNGIFGDEERRRVREELFGRGD